MKPPRNFRRIRRFLPAVLAALLPAFLPMASAGAEGLSQNPLLLDLPRNPVQALEFTSETLQGKPVRLSDYRGKVVMLNFWATWCVPCLLEMPAMERLNRKMAGRPFKLLAVNQAESRGHVESWVREHPFSFDLLLDPNGQIGANYGADRLPMTYIINPKGFVVRRAVGPREWDSPAALELFEKLMSGREAATAPATASTTR